MLHGRRVCIIGGGSGIGLATAISALSEGAEVWIGGRSTEKLAAARLESSGLRTAPVDVTADASLAAFFAAIGGRLDHLVVSVSTSSPGTIVETGLDVVRQAFETKYWGAYRAARMAAPLLEAGGSITLVSGITSRRPVQGMTNLSPLNAAVESLVRALAVELAPLRANGIAPGLIETPYWDSRLPDAEARAAMFARVGAQLPAGRIGAAEDCARAILYLMHSAWVTGTVLDVDGGFLIS